MMRNFYVKIGLLVVLGLVVSFCVFRLIVLGFSATEQRSLAVQWSGFGPGLIRQVLERAPVAERASALDALRADVDFEVRLVVRSASAPEQGPRAERRPPEGIVIFLPLRDDHRELVVGPMRPPTLAPRPIWLFVPLAILTIASISTAFVSLPLVRRLRHLQRATRELSRGALHTRIDRTGDDVISELSASFNDMAGRIEAMFKERQALVQAVVHEISTPLARMRFYIEAIGSATRSQGDAPKDALNEQLDELNALVTELSHWVEADGRPPRRVPLDVGLALDTICAANSSIASRRGVTLSLHGPSAIAEVDPRGFERAVDNLIRNAINYAQSRVDVRVEVQQLDPSSRAAHAVVVSVTDDGPGIPEADRLRVVEPFARVDPSRSRDSGGMGLGLAISNRIVAAHGGRLGLYEAPGGGLIATTHWPLLDTLQSRFTTDAA